MSKKIISVILSVIMVISCIGIMPVFAEDGDYTIVSPYEDVIWSGDGAWGAYKGNLHAHSTASDADEDFRTMVMGYYEQGYDFLAMTDHAVTGKAWNEKPTMLPLYLYQYIIGNKVTPLTDEEFEGVTTGTYPVDGVERGYGMTCIVGGNELNGLTVSKCHVNAFLPANVGNNHLGYENNHECAVKLAYDADSYCFINHPGDWLKSNRDRSVVDDPENIQYFSDILLRYDNCLGMEVFNEVNSVTPADRHLWDNLLMECLPYGKRVLAYSNSDAHNVGHIDTSFSVFMMEENTAENVMDTMANGAFFCVTRCVPQDDVFGPAERLNVSNQGLAYPEFTEVSVDGHKVTVRAKNCNNIQWVADGNVIASQDVEESENETTYVLDLDTIEGAEDFLYIRCQLLGAGGCNLTQALEIDNGTEDLTYEPDTSVKAKFANAWYRFRSLRVFVIFEALIDLIAKQFR